MFGIGPFVIMKQKELDTKLEAARADGKAQGIASVIKINPTGELKIDVNDLSKALIQSIGVGLGAAGILKLLQMARLILHRRLHV